jgi:hypothetical protein
MTVEALRGVTRGVRASDATPATRAWMATIEAEACTKLTDEVSCLEAFEQAHAALDTGDDTPGRPRATFFDQPRLAGEQALCNMRLSRLDDAATLFEHALVSLDPQSKIRARLLSGLAIVRIQQNDIDEACRLTGQAHTIASRTQTALSLDQVHDVRRQLEPWADTDVVRTLDDLLRG